MRTKVILFDIDGTLLAAGSAARRAFLAAFFQVFATPCDDSEVEFAGRSDIAIRRDVIRRSLAPTGRVCTEAEEEQLVRRYVALLETELQIEHEYQVLPGVSAICAGLQCLPHIHMGLQTGNIREAAELKLALGNLQSFFSFGGFGCDSELRKEIVATALAQAEQRLGGSAVLVPKYVIGDTPHDVIAGKENACLTIAVATGAYSAAQLAESQPDYLFDSFAEVDRFFDAIGEKPDGIA